MNKDFYNIYINDKLLQLIYTKDVSFIILKDGESMHDFDQDNSELVKAVERLESEEQNRIVIHSDSLDKLVEAMKAIFQVVHAAGGIVQNDKGEILSIFRRGNWDFPKGKIEAGEKKKECAIREVKEECGLTQVEIIKKLGATYHTYGNKHARKLKVSTWYVMNSNDKKLTPQTEEDIEIAKWFKLDDFMLHAKPVYKNIQDVFEAYLMKFN